MRKLNKSIFVFAFMAFWLSLQSASDVKLSSNFVGYSPPPGRKLAIIVGVGTYPEASALEQIAAEKDALDLKEAFSSHGWEVHLLLGSQVTKDSLYALINSLDIQAGDKVFVHLGGHGFNRNGVDYFIPFDGAMDSTAALRNIPVRDFHERMAQKAALTVTFVDACRNSVRGKPVTPPTDTLKIEGKRHAFLIQSTAIFQFAQERNGGVATRHLITLLKQRATQKWADNNKDGFLSVQEVYHFIHNKTDIATRRLGAAQTPDMTSNGDHNQILFHVQKVGNPEDKKSIEALAEGAHKNNRLKNIDSLMRYDFYFSHVRIPKATPSNVNRALANPFIKYVSVFVHDDLLPISSKMLGGLFYTPSADVRRFFHNYNPNSNILLLAYNVRTDPRVMRDLGHRDGRLLQNVVKAPSLYLYKIIGGELHPVAKCDYMHEPDLLAWIEDKCANKTSALPASSQVGLFSHITLNHFLQ